TTPGPLVPGMTSARAKNDRGAAESFRQQLSRRCPEAPQYRELLDKRQSVPMGAPENKATPVGQMLAAKRERQGLSRLDIAQRLHMSAYQVEALESGDYKR